MRDRERDDESMKVLYRMLVYVRDEAMRLHLGEVALLLDQAGRAMATFAPMSGSETGENGLAWHAGPSEH